MPLDRPRVHGRPFFRLGPSRFDIACPAVVSTLTLSSIRAVFLVVALVLCGVLDAPAQQSVWDEPVPNCVETTNRVETNCPVVGHAEPSPIEFQPIGGMASAYPSPRPAVLPVQYEEPSAVYVTPPIEALPSVNPTPVVPNDPLAMPPCPADPWWSCWSIHGLARGYYLNDQRIEWSGLEATCGAEGVIAPVFRQQFDNWETSIEGEFYLNQPFDRNILVDTPTKVSYLGNYAIEPFEISQLLVCCRRGDISIKAGKMVTPFGRTYFPLYTNSRVDAPFIRTEAILWRETGFLIRYQPGIFVGDVAITNGSENMDTNSSKALVSRVGLENECSAVGLSVKWQDGIGSEDQKQFNRHAGADAMVRFGSFQLSGECIYEEYGFYHPYDPNKITWRHSIYYRDLNRAIHVPLSGVGYYMDLGYNGEKWNADLNYGEYYPTEIGNLQHDIPNRRGIVKIAYRFTPAFQGYGAVLMETAGMIAQDGGVRKGEMVLGGLQYVF